MPDQPIFDLQTAHRFFSADCFNRAWELMVKADRSPDEDEEMLRLSIASTWHWSRRSDCQPENLSVGYWQTARIWTLLNHAGNALRYAQMSLDTASNAGLEPFYVGYACEAMARAYVLAGNLAPAGEYLQRARGYLEQVTDAEDRQVLERDLEELLI